MSKRSGNVSRRRRGRVAALQMLYQWEVGRAEVEDVLQSFPAINQSEDVDLDPPVEAFGAELVRGTVAHLVRIDPLISEAAEHWRLSRMAIVDRIILRLATYELLAGETPAKVVIDEAVELAKMFSAPEAAGFINGILDAVKRRLEATPQA